MDLLKIRYTDAGNLELVVIDSTGGEHIKETVAATPDGVATLAGAVDYGLSRLVVKL